MKYILSVDQGTTGSRAILYRKDARAVASHYNEFRQYFPRPGWVEHDAEEIWDSVNKSVQRVMNSVPDAEIQAIGITNQRETVVLWDRHTGKPVTKAIVWQCRRTAERCAELSSSKKFANMILKKTGLPVDAYFSATKIEWILRNFPAIRKKALKGDIVFGTIDSWLIWKFTGEKVHATEPTNASRTMLFNIDNVSWDNDLFKHFGIPYEMAPEIRPSSGIFGYTVKKGRLKAGIPIAGTAGDQQAALFGQACFEKGSVKNTYGTGSFILLNAGSKRPSGVKGLITTLGCGGKGEHVYVLEGAVFVAGAAIQWLRDCLGLLPDAAMSQKMAEKVQDNAGVYFVPALVGLGAPYWNSEARGLITGITRCTKKEHIVRAAIEAMCYQTKDVVDVMEKMTGAKIRALKIDGGASKNDFLCRFQADLLGIKVIRSGMVETTSLGAAYLAGLASGFWKSPRSIEKYRKQDKTFVPGMPVSMRRSLYAGWEKALKKTLT